MKKVGKILLSIVLLIGIIVGGISLFMRHQIKQTYKRLDEVAIVDLSAVEDGIYEGIEETDLVKVSVVVTVKDHQITDIQLTRHENGKGTPAEAMIPEMIRQNTSEVDAVSGATMSSKTIKASVRNALAQGINGNFDESVSGQTEDDDNLATGKVIMPVDDPMKEYMKYGILNGVYHVTANGAEDYASDKSGQYMNLEFWSYDTFD